jgi:hypothetical protein
MAGVEKEFNEEDTFNSWVNLALSYINRIFYA